MDLVVRTDSQFIDPNVACTRYVLASIQAPKAQSSSNRSPVNTCIVLDRSGSMGGNKLVLAQRAVEETLGLLGPSDRFGLLVYDDVIETITESSPATDENKALALKRLASVEARGRTDLARGWLLGCEQISLHSNGKTIDRCLLLTDGVANTGMTDPLEIIYHAGQLQQRGIETSTFGLGAEFDERFLQRLADAGGGHFYFVENAVQIADCLANEIGEAIDVVARNVQLRATELDGTVVTPIHQARADRDGDGVRIVVGNLVSAQKVELVLEVEFEPQLLKPTSTLHFSLVQDRGASSPVPIRLIRWKKLSSDLGDSQSTNGDVILVAAELLAAQAREKALEQNRAGEYHGASEEIESVMQKLGELGKDDGDVLRIVKQLEEEKGDYQQAMSSIAKKRKFYASSTISHMRDSSGKARK